MNKAPNDVDRHVGSRVRLRRTLVGMSQEKLGEALGVTFQQIQKYEKGTNRISASRLQMIAEVLGVSLDYLYEGAGRPERAGFAEGGQAGYDSEMMNADGLKLIKAFNAIGDARVRRRIVDLVQALAREPSGERSE